MTRTHVQPDDAVEQYLQNQHDITESTLDNHRYRLNVFTRWCGQDGINDLTDLSGDDLQRYHTWRHSESGPDCAPITIQQHMHTLRVFLRWAEDAEIVDSLADKMPICTVTADEQTRDDTISHERATNIIEYLEKYKWASIEHITFGLLYDCGMRRSALRALDVEDWYPERQEIDILNREQKGTRIKLGAEGERLVKVNNDTLADALNDWVSDKRPDVTDDYGRKPLIATKHGRAHGMTIQKICYKITRPCMLDYECPHDRDPSECEATTARNASKCPSSRSPHPLRRAAITHYLDEDIPKEIVSERMSVSQPVLDQHYDARSKRQKIESRKQHYDDADL